MADDKTEETEVEETEEEEVEETEETDDKGWDRLGGIVRSIVKEELTTWSGSQRSQTSSHSQRKQVKKAAPKPVRKQGFFSSGMFKGLGPEE